MTTPDSGKGKRMCTVFRCKARKGGRYCCADCYMRQKCEVVCKNHPDRCGLVAPAETDPATLAAEAALKERGSDHEA